MIPFRYEILRSFESDRRNDDSHHALNAVTVRVGLVPLLLGAQQNSEDVEDDGLIVPVIELAPDREAALDCLFGPVRSALMVIDRGETADDFSGNRNDMIWRGGCWSMLIDVRPASVLVDDTRSLTGLQTNRNRVLIRSVDRPRRHAELLLRFRFRSQSPHIRRARWQSSHSVRPTRGAPPTRTDVNGSDRS
jgi:hypothetical protein